MKHHYVAAAGLDAVENVSKMIQIEMIADRHKNIPGPRADGLRTQFAFKLKVELVHLHMSAAAISGAALGNRKHDVQNHGKKAAGDCCYWLSEEVRDRDGEQGQRDQAKPDRNLHAANIEI